jgi:hypothetical protein
MIVVKVSYSSYGIKVREYLFVAIDFLIIVIAYQFQQKVRHRKVAFELDCHQPEATAFEFFHLHRKFSELNGVLLLLLVW